MDDTAVILSLVAAGSACGGVARFFVSGLVARAIGETFPWGTLVVNAGAFAIGILAFLYGDGGADASGAQLSPVLLSDLA